MSSMSQHQQQPTPSEPERQSREIEQTEVRPIRQHHFSPTQLTPARIMHLQRTRGNQFVTALIRRQKPQPMPQSTPHPVIQRKMAVQVVMSDQNQNQVNANNQPQFQYGNQEERVEDILIGGRPENLFGNAMGDHTTAWAVIIAGVQNALKGRTIQEAINEINRLVQDAKNLPGNTLDNLPQQHKDRLNIANQRIDTIKDEFRGQQPTHQHLQAYTRAYIEFRHAIPLSAAYLGKATGKGESAPIDYLRQQEFSLRKQNPPQQTDEFKANICSRMWELLDMQAVENIANDKYKSTTKKEIDRFGADQIKDRIGQSRLVRIIATIISQHFASLKSAYPKAFEASQIEGNGEIMKFLKKWDEGKKPKEIIINPQDIQAISYAVLMGNVQQAFPPQIDDNQVLSDRNPHNRFAAEVVTETDNQGNEIVKEFISGSRPKNLFKGAMGDHTTAWGLIELGVKRAVEGKTIQDAIAAITGLKGEAEQLPGVALVNDNLDADLKQRYDAAKISLDNLANNINNTFNFLQKYIHAYFEYRHIIPLSAASLGPASGKGEAERLNFLTEKADQKEKDQPKQHGPIILSNIRIKMWELLDADALYKISNPDEKTNIISNRQNQHNANNQQGNIIADNNKDLEDKAAVMGADQLDSYEKKMAGIIRQHLMSVKSVFPNLYDQSQIASKASVTAFMNKHGNSLGGDPATQKPNIIELLQNSGILTHDDPKKITAAEAGKQEKKSNDTGEGGYKPGDILPGQKQYKTHKRKIDQVNNSGQSSNETNNTNDPNKAPKLNPQDPMNLG